MANLFHKIFYSLLAKLSRSQEFIDHRKNIGIRRDVQIIVQMEYVNEQGKQKKIFTNCRDISTHGMFIETDKTFPNGTEIKLTFTVPESETIKTSAIVIWNKRSSATLPEDSGGIGVSFTSLEAIHSSIINAYVSKPQHESGSFKESA